MEMEVIRENLSDAVHHLLAVRSGLNLIHILSGQRKAGTGQRTLAAVITGAGSITPLILVTTFFVMSVWALGEALMDVKGLLAGRKVMLFKAAEDWTLSAEKLLALGRDGKPDTGGGERRIFLSFLAENPAVCGTPGLSGVSDHGCDRVKSGTGKTAGSGCGTVCIRCISLGLFVESTCSFSPAFVENLTGNHEQGMMMTVKTERRY